MATEAPKIAKTADRVIAHARAKLAAWERRHVRRGVVQASRAALIRLWDQGKLKT